MKSKRITKALSLLVSMVLVCTMVPFNAYGDELIEMEEAPAAADIEASEDDSASAEDGIIESSEAADSDQIADDSNAPMLQDLTDQLGGDGDIHELDSISEELVDFFYIDNKAVTYEEEQYVALGFTEPMGASSFELTYQVIGEDEVKTTSATSTVEDAVLFALSFDGASSVGEYRLIDISWGGDRAGRFDVPQSEDGASFVVTEPHEECQDGTTVSTLDEDGDLVELESIPDAIHESDIAIETAAVEAEQATRSVFAPAIAEAAVANANGQIVVALDPGHGGSDPGAGYGGLREKNLTLSIARYCREALSQYRDIKVVMTRDSDTYIGVQDRAILAKQMGATLFVSFHINAGGGSGFEVWVQNDSSWRHELHQESQELGQRIVDKLASLGLNRGTKESDEDSRRYPDGSIGDYLGVLYRSRLENMPAILIEHGFIDNASDRNMLSQDSYLRRMGQLDAEGIAEYYGLGSGPEPYVRSVSASGDVTLAWDAIPTAQKYAISIYENGIFHTQNSNWSSTSYMIKGLQIGRTYTFLVQAYTPSGWTSTGPSARFTAAVVPTPVFSAAPAGDGKVRLSWQPVANASCYAISELMPDGQYRAISRNAQGTNYEVDNLANGYAHRFLVQAKVDDVWSSPSTYLIQSVTPAGTMKPGSVKAAAAPGGKVILTWTSVPGASYYSVSSKWGDNGYVGHSRNASGNSYTVSGLVPGREYTFVVTAYIGHVGQWSKFDNSDLVTLFVEDPTSPAFTATTAGDGKVRLSWQPVANASCYAISELMPDGQYRAISRNAQGTNYEVDNLANGYAHRFLVQAKVDDVWSSPSTYLIQSVTPAGTMKPGSVKAAAAPGGKVILTWTSVPGASYYSVSSKWGDNGYVGHSRNASGNSYTVSGLVPGREYTFVVTAYIGHVGQWSKFDNSDLVTLFVPGYEIMGSSTVTIAQMVAYYQSTGHQYPSNVYKNYYAPTLWEFCEKVYIAATAEGVKPEVLFCQAMKETGWLRFGGIVQPWQCNFGGIGAVDGNAQGNCATFASVGQGLRAQAQHLKAYASTQAPNGTVFDPRFNLVTRNSAPYVEWLGIQENPYGKGWASGKNYGYDIVDMISRLKSF